MRLVSSNFREILPERVSTLTGSMLITDFERAMVTQYAMYRWPLRVDIGPCVVVFKGKPYFNYDMLCDIAVNCWFGTEASLVRYLGIQGKPGDPIGRREKIPPIWRAIRAIRLGRAAAKSQEASQVVDFDAPADVSHQLSRAHAAFCRSLLNHLLVGTAAAIVYQITESLLRLLSNRANPVGVHHVLNQQVQTASGLQQQAFRKLISMRKATLTAPQSSASHAAFQVRFDEYLAHYGYRCIYELELGTPRDCEQPDSILREIVEKLSFESQATSNSVCADPELRLFAKFASILSKPAQQWTIRRERSKSMLARCAASLRATLLAAGKSLEPCGLKCPEDIFNHTMHDILEAMAFTASHTRDASHQHNIQLPQRRERSDAFMPEFWDTTKRLASPDTDHLSTTNGKTLQGVAVSKGVIVGSIRTLSRPEEALDVENTSILVIRALDSSWLAALVRARGVITEVGGVLSHAAIVAREHGIPAVFNVSDALAKLPNGTQVELDGGSGVVRIISSALVASASAPALSSRGSK